MVPTAAGGKSNNLIWSLPEPESAGASTYVIVLEANDQGECGYLPEPDRPRQFKLGRSFASTRVAFIHTLRTVLLMDPSTNALRGLAAFIDGHLQLYYFGALWGSWSDDEGRRHSESDPLSRLISPKFFIRLGKQDDRIRVEFSVTPNNPELFVPSVRKRLRQAGSDYRIALDFSIPGGKFLLAEVVAVDPNSGVSTMAYPVEGFPFKWPSVATAQPGLPTLKRSPAADSHAPESPDGVPRGGGAENRSGTPSSQVSTPPGSLAGHPPEARPSSSYANVPGRTPGRAERPGSPPPQSRPVPDPTDGGRGQDAPPQKAKLRLAPKLRLKPRSADPGGGASSPSTPPPTQNTSYRMRPGQISDPLGRKTPLGDAGNPERRPPTAPPPPSTRLREPVRASVASTPPPKPAPLPRTEGLSTKELIDLLRKESDPDRRWKMMEPNLMMGRAERTYSLIANFAELISDRSPEWPAVRLRTAFSSQPGAVLIGIMDRWHMNQVLAVADVNSESAKIMQWLREREVDRMLRLKIKREITNAEQARQALRVDRSADEAAIRKTWRILLQFLNADHGRSDEKAIHRQKDEIAKYLQVARDYLLKVTFR